MNSTNTRAPRALFAACALLAGAAFAGAPPPTKQNAAAGLVTAFYLREQLPWHTNVLVYSSRDLADRALRVLAPATSASQLLATPAGVSVPCPVSGAIIARLSPRSPNVLKLQWTACTFEIYGWHHTLDGPGEIVLSTLSLSPNVVAGIRLGNRDSDLVVKMLMLQSEQTVPNLNIHNSRLTGLITLTRADVNDVFSGTSTFEMSGFFDERTHYNLAGAGDELFEARLTLSAENALVNTTGQPYGDYDLRVLRGRLSYEASSAQGSGAPPFLSAYAIEPRGLRLRQTAGVSGDDAFQIDGTVSVDWPDFFEMECHQCTDFTYRTSVPLHGPMAGQGLSNYDAGELWINGTTRSRFSYVVDENFSENMRVEVDARGRQHEFMVPWGSSGWGDLGPAAACAP